jgi:glycerol-3-phosphate dehydrogenase (NAD(P)+)
MPKAAIIGNTTWGNTLGALLSNNGVTATLWTRSESEAERLNQENHSYTSTDDIAEAVRDADLLILAVPSQKLRENINQVKHHLGSATILMSAAKGLETDSGKRMSQIIEEEVAPSLKRQICVLSGPNLAREISQGLPAVSVIAAQDAAVARKAKSLLQSPRFLIFTTDDVIGVELSGALKNIAALGAGVIDGLKLGDNAKAAFIALNWNEAVSLGVTLGARCDTFYGLAGLGDLIATCASTLSRNHYVGYQLAEGRSLAEISASMPQIAEGVTTTRAVHQLNKKLGIKAPVTELVYRILFESLPPLEMATSLGKLISS